MKVLVMTDEPALKTALLAALLDVGVELTEESQEADVTLLDMCPEFNYDQLAQVTNRGANNVILWGRSIEVGMAYQASQIGVKGFVSKLDTVVQQADQLVKAGEGAIAWSDALVREMLGPQAKRVPLTHREGQLIIQLCRGAANKEIAHNMGITEGTVKIYLSRLFTKLNVSSRLELALYGLRAFGTPSEPSAPMVAPRTVFLPATTQRAA
jgi:DNA-binding NarL/FixJ family response regulator